jgi:hypothetical protein
MIRFLAFIALCLSFSTLCQAQQLDPKYNRDSLFNALVMKLPEPKRQQYREGYITSGVKDKDFYIYILNMPVSSKEALTSNISRKKAKINELVKSYNALVPKGYSVFVEFNPEDKLFKIPASIDLHITQGTETDTGHDLAYGSADLKKKLDRLGWTTQTLDTIKKLLADAGCISIENNDVTIVGFARSGMGKYGFLVFPKVLNNTEITEYNDGCHYIYHENNMVLTYGGGAVGPDCFPD